MTTERAPFPSDAADKFLLRLPDGMREQLKAAAKGNNRTMNAEIVSRLQSTLVQPEEKAVWLDALSKKDGPIDLRGHQISREQFAELGIRLAKIFEDFGVQPDPNLGRRKAKS